MYFEPNIWRECVFTLSQPLFILLNIENPFWDSHYIQFVCAWVYDTVWHHSFSPLYDEILIVFFIVFSKSWDFVPTGYTLPPNIGIPKKGRKKCLFWILGYSKHIIFSWKGPFFGDCWFFMLFLVIFGVFFGWDFLVYYNVEGENCITWPSPPLLAVREGSHASILGTFGAPIPPFYKVRILTVYLVLFSSHFALD